MRRKDREISDPEEISAILSEGRVLHLALADNNIPFVVPLFYFWDKKSLYVHSAPAGSKVEILKKNNVACFEVSLDNAVIPDEKPCDFEAKHRTVIGLGRVYFVNDYDEKVKALRSICSLFSDKTFDFPRARVDATLLMRIDPEWLKGKKHGF